MRVERADRLQEHIGKNEETDLLTQKTDVDVVTKLDVKNQFIGARKNTA